MRRHQLERQDIVNSRFSLSFAVLVAGVALMAGCSPHTAPSASNPGSPTAGAVKPLHLAFVTNNASDYWTIARKGTEKAQKDLQGVSVDFRIPSDGTAAEQTGIINDLLAKGVDGFAISPVDPTNQTQELNKAAKQVLVFTQDSDAPKSNRACYVGTDNVAAGRQVGQLIKQALPNGGQIMLFVGKIDAQNARDRYQGIKEALAGSKVQILDVRTDETDRAKAKSNVSDTLVKYPNIAGLVGLWSYNGPAILSAVKDANMVGKVKIICFDEEDETLAGVKSGAIVGTVVQQPFEMGYQSMKLMSEVLRGNKSVIPASKQIFIPTEIIQKNNVDAFRAQLTKLRAG